MLNVRSTLQQKRDQIFVSRGARNRQGSVVIRLGLTIDVDAIDKATLRLISDFLDLLHQIRRLSRMRRRFDCHRRPIGQFSQMFQGFLRVRVHFHRQFGR